MQRSEGSCRATAASRSAACRHRAGHGGARRLARAACRGRRCFTEAGAIPYDPDAADEFYLRTTAETSVDVNGILGGKPG